MRNRFLARYATPILALGFCLSVVLGGSLPELGNLTAYHFPEAREYPLRFFGDTHYFNGYFLVAGVLGVIVCGIALYRRLLQFSTSRMVNRKETKNGV